MKSKSLQDWGPKMMVEAVTWALEHGVVQTHGIEVRITYRGVLGAKETWHLTASCYITYQIGEVYIPSYLGWVDVTPLLPLVKKLTAANQKLDFFAAIGLPLTTKFFVNDQRHTPLPRRTVW